MSFMEAFNQEKIPFLPVLSSKRGEAELSGGQQQMREEWDKVISQVRAISHSPHSQHEHVGWMKKPEASPGTHPGKSGEMMLHLEWSERFDSVQTV